MRSNHTGLREKEAEADLTSSGEGGFLQGGVEPRRAGLPLQAFYLQSLTLIYLLKCFE